MKLTSVLAGTHPGLFVYSVLLCWLLLIVNFPQLGIRGRKRVIMRDYLFRVSFWKSLWGVVSIVLDVSGTVPWLDPGLSKSRESQLGAERASNVGATHFSLLLTAFAGTGCLHSCLDFSVMNYNQARNSLSSICSFLSGCL